MIGDQPFLPPLPAFPQCVLGQQRHCGKRWAAHSHRNDLLHGWNNIVVKKTSRGMLSRNNQPLQFLPGIARERSGFLSPYLEGSALGGARERSRMQKGRAEVGILHRLTILACLINLSIALVSQNEMSLRLVSHAMFPGIRLFHGRLEPTRPGRKGVAPIPAPDRDVLCWLHHACVVACRACAQVQPAALHPLSSPSHCSAASVPLRHCYLFSNIYREVKALARFPFVRTKVLTAFPETRLAAAGLGEIERYELMA